MANNLYGSGGGYERPNWEPIEYARLPTVFMDNFLLRYFYRLIKTPDENLGAGPWKVFLRANPWVEEMPDLFALMSGYQLTEGQLDRAVVEYCQRVAKMLTFQQPEAPERNPYREYIAELVENLKRSDIKADAKTKLSKGAGIRAEKPSTSTKGPLRRGRKRPYKRP
jgi:hypothetical protein